MQAPQSNNASDIVTLDLNGDARDANLSRIFSSPFSTPIQAARRYIERQWSESSGPVAREGETEGREGLLAAGRPPTRDSEDLNRGLREETIQESSRKSSRERDRRLERSLYEGHSIEAGLNFDDRHGSDAGGTAMAGRATLTESDGSEPLFRYTVPEAFPEAFPGAFPGPAPNPDLIRGAIVRLARESEFRREHTLSSREDSRVVEKGVPSHPSEIESGQSLNFGDVARRVWEASVAQPGVTGAATSELDHATQAMDAPDLPANRETQTIGLEESKKVFSLQEVPAPEDSQRSGSRIGQAEGREDISRHTARPASVMQVMTECQEAPLSRRTSVTKIFDVDQVPALAHDACNLLAALALYSELLGTAGVLGEQHRHYAEELKLMAVRSQALIGRLLLVAAPQKEPDILTEDFGAPAPLGSRASEDTNPDPRSAISSALGYGQTVQSVAQQQADARVRANAELDDGGLSEGAHRVGQDMVGTSTSDAAEQTVVRRAAGVPKEAEATNLADLLKRWGSLLETLAHGTLEVVLGPDAGTPVPAGAEALERILVNLVRNAREATVGGGAIRIGVGMEEVPAIATLNEEIRAAEPRTAQEQLGQEPRRGDEDGTMVLTVDDSGCGMAQSQIRGILRKDESKDDAVVSTGSAVSRLSIPVPERKRGLGLQIVRELVATSGGTLSIQSWPGRGTRIEIRWPVLVPFHAEAPSKATLEIVERLAERTPTVIEIDSPAATPITPSLKVVPLELTRAPVGPDGFSEIELRAMMLRLHRTGPQIRGPLSRRLSNRPLETVKDDRGFAIEGSVYEVQKNNRAPEDRAAKGAIAC